MSQRRTKSACRKRFKRNRRASTVIGNLLLESLGFGALLFVLFFINTTPADTATSQIDSNRSNAPWQDNNDFRAYVSELFATPIQLTN